MPDTRFRSWMTTLCQPDGDRPEWPLLVRWALQEHLHREQSIHREYAGQNLLICRTDDDYMRATGEKRAARGLYHRSHELSSGCITIGDERYWLLSYEVPNQDHYRMRRADLVGMNLKGGLVVFECKLGQNRYAPLASVLEGLDYLACLTNPTNFTRLQGEFWSLGLTAPDGFAEVEPSMDACHEVVVLAPRGYYGLYDRSNRGNGWRDFANTRTRNWESVRIAFAESEIDADGFFSRQLQWVQPE
ncbi:MAG: hypothetical protein NTZ32_24480 [Planctomycetales bacterium]|nr:hypothetical protein [Planctomycetales bacterium]